MAEANQQEPSMEEILSSIRRIISADTPAEEAKPAEEEEEAAPPPPPPPPEEEPEEEEDEDVLELTDVVEPDSDDELDIDVDQEIDSFEPAAHFGEPEIADEDDDELPEEEPEEEYVPPPVRDRDFQQADSELVSPPTAAASMAAFASLNSAARGEPLPFDVGGRTVEQLAAELMRPILREWLDQNLPSMVERLVRAEIKRLAEQSRR
ncbi:MAG: pole-organizing protein PopZ [Rhodospirillaceae bacterium]|jgi:cell pole-organizing protein PopZ|nr:pole-organizing protein PopZ [Rhodospirillaceae bacterium]